MTEFDYVAFSIVGLSLLLSLLRGAVREVLSLLTWGLAFYLGNRHAEDVVVHLSWAEQLTVPMRAMAGFATVFVMVLLTGWVLTRLVSKLVSAIGLGWVDRVLGLAFGAARGVLIVLVLVTVAGLTSLPQKPFWRDALLSGHAEESVRMLKPHLPPAVVKWVRY